MDFVRKIVSKQKKRFEWGNFDLDLTYITDRIIAMGFPSESIEGLYRNNMKDVQRFFNTLHPEHFKIYNLCSERKYDHDKFAGMVSEFPFEDHNPPTLDMISKFCEDVEEWLDKHPENIVGIHCKAGKGRTGTVIACWLMFNRNCSTSSESMRLFGNKRTHNGKGVTIPSQARYVRYFEALLSYGRPIRLAPNTTKVLSSIHMNALPDFNIGGGCEPYLCIVQQDKSVFYTKPLKLKKGTKQVEIDCGNIILSNDVKIRFYNKNSKGYMFSYCFHTAFIDTSRLCIRRIEIDKAHKDTKHFPPNFSIELHFCEDLLEEDLIDIGFKEPTENNNTNNNNNNNNTNNQFTFNSIPIQTPNKNNNNQLYGTSYFNNLDKLYISNQQNNQNNNNNNNNTNSSTTITTTISNTTTDSNNNENSNNDSDNFKTRTRAFSSKEVFKCPKCNLNILSTEVSVNDGLNNYHWKCLTCNQCSKSLMKDNNCLFQGNGKTLCLDCGTQSGFFKFCSGCNLIIKTSNFEEFGDLIFHKSCFLCCTCLCYLVGKDFIVKDKLLQCSTCVENIKKQKDIQDSIKNNEVLIENNIKNNEIIEDYIEIPTTNQEEITIGDKEVTIEEIQIPIDTTTAVEPIEIIKEVEKEEIPMDTTVASVNESTEISNEVSDSGIICTKCNLTIGLRPIIVESGIYHKDCFICKDCSVPLSFNTYKISSESSQPICEKCERVLMKKLKDQLFKEEQMQESHSDHSDCDDTTSDEESHDSTTSGNKLLNSTLHNVICFGCKKIIEDEEMMDAIGEKWHIDCLICITCKKPIEGAFGDHQGLLYCRDHYADIVGIKCDHCTQVIDSIFVKFNGRKLHSHCFVCFNCNKILQDGKYYEKNGNILCEFCRSVDIIKRRTQLQLQQSFIGVKRSSSANKDSTNQTTTSSIDLNNNTLNNNNNNISSLENTLNESSSPIQSFMSRTTQNFRQSTRINISDFKITNSTISNRRGLTFYPSLHRQMPIRFKTAHPTSTKPRKDFLSLNKSLTNTI